MKSYAWPFRVCVCILLGNLLALFWVNVSLLQHLTRDSDLCAAQAANNQAVGGGAVSAAMTANLHPFDPEHLIVNGLGGAFLHPTHVFAPARFASVPDPAADDLFEAGLSPRGRSPMKRSPSGASPPRGRSPSGASPRRTLSRRGSFIGAHCPHLLQCYRPLSMCYRFASPALHTLAV